MTPRLAYVVGTSSSRVLVQFADAGEFNPETGEIPDLEPRCYYLWPADCVSIEPLESCPASHLFYGYANVSWRYPARPKTAVRPNQIKEEEPDYRPDREVLEAHKKAKEKKERDKNNKQGSLF